MPVASMWVSTMTASWASAREASVACADASAGTRASSRTGRVRCIVASGWDRNGCDGFVLKPLLQEQLLLRQFGGRQRTPLRPAARRAHSTPPPATEDRRG